MQINALRGDIYRQYTLTFTLHAIGDWRTEYYIEQYRI